MNHYSEMLAEIAGREAELVAELDRVRELKNALETLATLDSTRKRPRQRQPLGIQQTSTGGAAAGPSAIKVTMRRSTMADLAYQVLAEAGQELPLKKLMAGVQVRGGGQGRNAVQLRGSLVPTLRRRTDLFASPRRGFYGLREWETKSRTA